MNWRGQISGAAETSTKDPSCTPPHVLDYLGVIWQPNGKITTLPPYSGDTVSYAYTITQSGQDVAGNSGSCSSPATHAVLWHNAAPINLGGLGGSVNLALDVNDWGRVIGNSDLAGNAVTHTFLWQNGTMRDLGTLPGDLNSFAGGINDEGQVVGQSCDASGNCRGYLWQNGTMTDLNTLIAPSKGLNVLFGADINDLGEIVGATVNQQGLEQGFIFGARRDAWRTASWRVGVEGCTIREATRAEAPWRALGSAQTRNSAINLRLWEETGALQRARLLGRRQSRPRDQR